MSAAQFREYALEHLYRARKARCDREREALSRWRALGLRRLRYGSAYLPPRWERTPPAEEVVTSLTLGVGLLTRLLLSLC
jgi:hypothetical protein